MDPKVLRRLLGRLRNGRASVNEVMESLGHFPSENLGFARVDHQRALRQGFPEVIFGQGKTVEQTVRIASALLLRNPNLLITRTSAEVFSEIRKIVPSARFHSAARCVAVKRSKSVLGTAPLPILSAGTSDFPVAEEARVTAEVMGNRVQMITDVGVAGIHRLLEQTPRLRRCRVAIVVAGMEGALPSVVGGLIGVPVIGVPTSVGYGAAFGGVAALLGMLNSCASNVTVVNIDNGFGAAFVASLINRKRKP
jgi:NCAIR mutase (PurE)-related protein